MTKVGKVFKFVAPNGWEEDHQTHSGIRYRFRGPNREELIISTAVIQGIGQQVDLQKIRAEVFQNAQKSVEHGAEHPELTIIQRFQKENSTTNECWTFRAQTRTGDVL